ncbi:hypothetical protein ACFQZ8_03370 [Micromonospora azadirachtae]|uniref:Uncharacterized protein n=1 Tax=Micromonospora azadirachtae TaxID=1970735 RepID=A0ABW2ZXA5_9ACTN
MHGQPSIDLDVPDFVPRADVDDGLLPVNAHVRGASGDAVGELLLWVKDGALAALEYAWYTDEPPTSLTAADSIVIEA